MWAGLKPAPTFSASLMLREGEGYGAMITGCKEGMTEGNGHLLEVGVLLGARSSRFCCLVG